MTPFARIVAATLAILMASPFCCCFARHSDGDSHSHAKQSKHSCCSHNDEDPGDAPADNTCKECSAKTPRVADGGKTSSPVPVLFELGALPLDTIVVIAAPASTYALVVDGIPPDLRRPPRLLLALQQRFLI
ncbi:MAG TPA: hypothetical protein PLA50_01470 [Bacteroidia bacterium]|nr:hypothetical protein [Bacteroidia bacterium]